MTVIAALCAHLRALDTERMSPEDVLASCLPAVPAAALRPAMPAAREPRSKTGRVMTAPKAARQGLAANMSAAREASAQTYGVTDPRDIGLRVLAALDRGRAIAIARARERARPVHEAVARLAAEDAARGHPARGRSGRIARRLRGLVSERHVLRVLDTLSSMSDSARYPPVR